MVTNQKKSINLIAFSETHPLQNKLASVDKSCWVILVDYRQFSVVKTFHVPMTTAFPAQVRPRHHLPSIFHFGMRMFRKKKKEKQEIRD